MLKNVTMLLTLCVAIAAGATAFDAVVAVIGAQVQGALPDTEDPCTGQAQRPDGPPSSPNGQPPCAHAGRYPRVPRQGELLR